MGTASKLATDLETSVTFRPSQLFGWYRYDEITIHPNRLEISRGEKICRRITFWSMAQRIESKVRLAKRMFWPRQHLMIGERSFNTDPSKAYIIFHSRTPLTICMPTDDTRNYSDCMFRRIQNVLSIGNFATFDLN